MLFFRDETEPNRELICSPSRGKYYLERAASTGSIFCRFCFEIFSSHSDFFAARLLASAWCVSRIESRTHGSRSHKHTSLPNPPPAHADDMDLTIDKSTPEKRIRLEDERPTSSASPHMQKIALDLSSHNATGTANNNENDNVQVVPQVAVDVSLNGQDNITATDIRYVRLLCDNPSRKFMAFEGEYNGKPAVVTLEKQAFNEEAVQDMFSPESPMANVLKRCMSNDIYGNYTLLPPQALNQIKTVVIHPATQKHIDKYLREGEAIVSTPTLLLTASHFVSFRRISSRSRDGRYLQECDGKVLKRESVHARLGLQYTRAQERSRAHRHRR